MIFLTSISPKHILEGRQQNTVKSWLKFGEVYSLNNESEIEVLKTQGYDKAINFIPTNDTQQAFWGKPYLRLNALVNFALDKKFDEFCIINSDIEINTDTDMDQIRNLLSNGFVYLHRWDYNGDKQRGAIYKLGVDAFFFTREMAKDLPQTTFCLGHTHFDIWLPFWYAAKKYNIISITSKPIIYHQVHQVQYDQAAWRIMGKYCAGLIGFHELKPDQISQKIYNTIYRVTNYA